MIKEKRWKGKKEVDEKTLDGEKEEVEVNK